MTVNERSAFSDEFLDTVKQWFKKTHDIFVVVRYSRTGGGKYYFWFKSFATFREKIDQFPPQADVIVFREKQFFLQGEVNEDFIEKVLSLIPENVESMVARFIEPPDISLYLSVNDSHAEIRDTLQDMMGDIASVGFYAPWHEADNEK